MMNIGRPLAALKPYEWMTVIDALRYAAHADPDEAHEGLDDEKQREIHAVADKLVAELEIHHDCQECDMANSGHTEPEENCDACRPEGQ
jgi:hypothetical protein